MVFKTVSFTKGLWLDLRYFCLIGALISRARLVTSRRDSKGIASLVFWQSNIDIFTKALI